jgi:hypothetical protein
MSPANSMHARVLFWVSIAMCAMAISAICAAELLMPDNVHGRNGVLTFYRVFGPCLVIEAAVAVWAHRQRRMLDKSVV